MYEYISVDVTQLKYDRPKYNTQYRPSGSSQVVVGDHIFRQHYLDLFLSRTFFSEILQTNELENNKTVGIGTFVLMDGFPFKQLLNWKRPR